MSRNIKTSYESVWRAYFRAVASHPCYMGCGAVINLDPVNYEGEKVGRNWDRSHIIADSMGGPDSVSNLRPACQTCNRKMGTAHMFDYMKENRLTPPIFDPAFEAHQYDGLVIQSRAFKERTIRVETVDKLAKLPIKGMVFAATGCGKTAMVIEGVGKHHIRGENSALDY